MQTAFQRQWLLQIREDKKHWEHLAYFGKLARHFYFYLFKIFFLRCACTWVRVSIFAAFLAVCTVKAEANNNKKFLVDFQSCHHQLPWGHRDLSYTWDAFCLLLVASMLKLLVMHIRTFLQCLIASATVTWLGDTDPGHIPQASSVKFHSVHAGTSGVVSLWPSVFLFHTCDA